MSARCRRCGAIISAPTRRALNLAINVHFLEHRNQDRADAQAR